MRCDRSSEAGVSLIEMLITVSIVGLAVVALIGALASGIKGALSHRSEVVEDSRLVSAAESIKAAAYQPCATTYDVAPSPAPSPDPSPEPQPSITVLQWDGGSTYGEGSCTSDKGLQLVKISLGPRELEVVKRRLGAEPSPSPTSAP